MRAETRDAVEQIFSRFQAEHSSEIEAESSSDLLLKYPFHRLIFSDKALLAARAERSVVTAMGTQLYPNLAQAVARDRFSDVYLEHQVTGNLNDAAVNMIEEIVTTLRTAPRRRIKDRRPDHERELREILSSLGEGSLNVQ